MQLSCIRFDVVTTSGPLYLCCCVSVCVPGITGAGAGIGRIADRCKLRYTYKEK